MKNFLEKLCVLALLAFITSALLPQPSAIAGDGDILLIQRSGTNGQAVQTVLTSSTNAILVSGSNNLATTSNTMAADQPLNLGSGCVIYTGTVSPVSRLSATCGSLFILKPERRAVSSTRRVAPIRPPAGSTLLRCGSSRQRE